MKRLIIVLLALISLCAVAQEPHLYVTETEDYIAWQPNVKLTFDMFQKSAPTERDLQVMQEDNRNATPYLGFNRVLDEPKTKSGWKEHFEKAYFCPMFSKYQSYIAVKDTFDLDVAQAQWDIVELGTRRSRIILDSLQNQANRINEVPTNGVVSIFYETASQEGIDYYHQILLGFLKEVVLPSYKEMFVKYRQLLDEMLEDTKAYSTSPEEAERLLLRKPLEKYLKEAKKGIGDLRKR